MVYNPCLIGERSMAVKFRILDKDVNQHSIVVRYYTDILSEDSLATSFVVDSDGNTIIDRGPDGTPKRCQTDYSINIWDVSATQPGANTDIIFQQINNSAPYDWFDLKEQIVDANVDTDMFVVDSLIGQVREAVRPIRLEPIIANANANISDSEIEQLIQALISSNTTPEASG